MPLPGRPPSYFFDGGRKPPIIGRGAMEIFRDETSRATAHNSLRLLERERQMILGIIRQFEGMQTNDDDHSVTP